MIRIKNKQFGEWIPKVLFCLVIMMLAGCETATVKEGKLVATQEDVDGKISTMVTTVEPEPQSEAIAPVTSESGNVSAPVAVREPGPGDGPPPREYINKTLEAMEERLSLLNAVPTK